MIPAGDRCTGPCNITRPDSLEHQPIALYPDELGFIFSGSAVYDTQNSSEYGTNENPPIIAIYTSHHKDGLEQQSIAYSNDKGRSFESHI